MARYCRVLLAPFFPVAVVPRSEVTLFNFGYLDCAGVICPPGEQTFSPGLNLEVYVSWLNLQDLF